MSEPYQKITMDDSYNKVIIGEQTCGNCKFSAKYDETGEHLKCRSHAPTAACDVEKKVTLTIWPIVVPGDWCGAWRIITATSPER